jgi:hypothetical protein
VTDLFEQRSTLLKMISVLLVAFAAYMSFLDGRFMQSADLLALWLAGEFLVMGQAEQVYPTVGAYFDMLTPDGWLGHITQTLPEARIYPYIYPPIWAKLASFVTPLTSFEAFDAVMMGVHQVLLIWGVYLAAHMTGLRKTLLWVIVSLTYAVLALTIPIGIALGETSRKSWSAS